LNRRTVQAPDSATDQRVLPPIESWDDAPPRAAGHSTLRLQPVILGPPPTSDIRDATADDDLDLRELNPRWNTGLIMGLAAFVVVLVTAGTAYLFLSGRNPEVAALPPVIQAAPEPLKQPAASPAEVAVQNTVANPPVPDPPPVAVPAPAPVVEAVAPSVTPSTPLPSPQQVAKPPTEALDMGLVSSELVPPTTDGLSPPRRVQAIRILVENDRELPPR
jgi:hypothetical protein